MSLERAAHTRNTRLIILVVFQLMLAELYSSLRIISNVPQTTEVQQRSASGDDNGETSASDIVDVSTYCRAMCQWGRGGNLCRCNAAYFAGRKRLSPLNGGSKVKKDRERYRRVTAATFVIGGEGVDNVKQIPVATSNVRRMTDNMLSVRDATSRAHRYVRNNSSSPSTPYYNASHVRAIVESPAPYQQQPRSEFIHFVTAADAAADDDDDGDVRSSNNNEGQQQRRRRRRTDGEFEGDDEMQVVDNRSSLR